MPPNFWAVWVTILRMSDMGVQVRLLFSLPQFYDSCGGGLIIARTAQVGRSVTTYRLFDLIWQKLGNCWPASTAVVPIPYHELCNTAVVGCVLHQPTSIPADFWAIWFTLRMCNTPPESGKGRSRQQLAADVLKSRCDGAAFLPFKTKSKRINSVRMEGVTCLKCPSTFMAFFGLCEDHEAARGDDQVDSARSTWGGGGG